METFEIIIATRSVALQQGLRALLESLQQVSHIEVAQELHSAYILIKELQPTVVLLDEGLLGKDPRVALEMIHTISPATRRVLLADKAQRAELVLAHAEAVCVKGISPDALAAIVTNLLNSKGDKK